VQIGRLNLLLRFTTHNTTSAGRQAIRSHEGRAILTLHCIRHLQPLRPARFRRWGACLGEGVEQKKILSVWPCVMVESSSCAMARDARPCDSKVRAVSLGHYTLLEASLTVAMCNHCWQCGRSILHDCSP
jgi:hypothetical protein